MDLNSVVSRIERELAGTFPALAIGSVLTEGALPASGTDIEEDLIAVLYSMVREGSVRALQIATGMRFCHMGPSGEAGDYATLSFTLKLDGSKVADHVCAQERRSIDLQSLVHEVEERNGSVELEATGLSRLRLTVSLPSCNESEEVDELVQGNGETVLLVEDEDFVRGVTREVLEMAGYRVLEASNGESAMRIFSENGGKVELLLTDVVMPGMNGRDLAGRVSKMAPNVKMLFMSGYTENAVLRHGLEDDCAAYLQKPFALETLIAKVREVLNGPMNGASTLETWATNPGAEPSGA